MRVIRVHRYGGAHIRPSAGERRAFRASLGGGRGVLGRAPRVVGIAAAATYDRMPMDELYDLFRAGTELLEAGHHHQAVIPLTRARDLAPDKSSIREALGRALFGAQRYEQAAREFEAVCDQRRRTTTHCSASAGRCSCSAATPRLAARSRWPPACSRRGATTASTATEPGPPQLALTLLPEGGGAALQTPPSVGGFCYTRRKSGANLNLQLSRRELPGSSTGSGRTPAFFI